MRVIRASLENYKREEQILLARVREGSDDAQVRLALIRGIMANLCTELSELEESLA